MLSIPHTHRPSLVYALLWVFVLGCSSPTIDSAEPPEVPDICNGSDDIQLYYGRGGNGADAARDWVVYADGRYFLKIDGHCHYYVYNGESSVLRSWAVVGEGDLDEAGLAEVLEALDVANWSSFLVPGETGMTGATVSHFSWIRPQLFGVDFTFDENDPLVGPMARGAAVFIPELAARSQPVVPEVLEVSVLRSPVSTATFETKWGGNRPMTDFLDDANVVFTGDPVEEMGTYVFAADEPWFASVREELRATGVPGAIGITNDQGDVTHSVYMRTVVPPDPSLVE